MKKLIVVPIFLAAVFYSVESLNNPIFNFVRHKALDTIEKAGANSECSSHLKRLVADLVKRKTWALQMLDASAKVQPGLLNGNVNLLGNFDECLDVRDIEKNSEINGQYCTVLLMPRANFTSDYDALFDIHKISQQLGYKDSLMSSDFMLNMVKVMYGICIPKSCTIGNLQKMWDYMEHTFSLPFHATFNDFMCSYKEKELLPFPVDKYSYAFFAVVLLVVALSTFYDVMIHQHLGDGTDLEPNIWVSFSLYTNFRKIFSFNTAPDSNLACLNGLKVISMLTVILAHRCLINMLAPNINKFYVFQYAKEFKSAFFQTGFYAVDSFFVMSGLLLSYGYGQYTEVLKKKFSLIGFYFYRILRICPALVAIVLFYISILKHMNEGPVWPILARKLSGSCLGTWWATVFFFSNWLSFDAQCMEQSWYLAADTQLYVVAPLILTYLYKHPKRTAILGFLICLSSSVYAFIITYVYRYGATFGEGSTEYQRYIYQPTFIRMPSWVLGIFLGYLIHKHKSVTIPKGLNVFLWILSISLFVFLVLVFPIFSRNPYSPLRSALYNALARPLWSLGTSFIIYSCVTGNGGAANRFLSHPMFGVLAKVSYSIYLVHLAVLFVLSGESKSSSYYSTTRNVHDFTGDTLFIFVAGTVWCLVFESPFINIGKLLYKKEMAGVMKNKEKKLVPYKKLESNKRISHKKNK